MGRGSQSIARRAPQKSTFGERSEEMTFNTKLDSAFRLAEPGSYSGTFGTEKGITPIIGDGKGDKSNY